MAKAPGAKTKRKDYSILGAQAAAAGDFETAKDLLEKAVAGRKATIEDRFNLSIVCEKTSDVDRAAELQTQILRAQPNHERSAQRLSRICRRFTLSQPDKLDPYGLRAGAAHPATGAQTFSNAMLAKLRCNGDFVAALDQPQTVASEMEQRVPDWASDPLLHDFLSLTLNTDPQVEELLTALRATLLALPFERFGDKALTQLAVSLAKQFDRCEFVSLAEENELAQLGALSLDIEALGLGHREAANALLKKALYSSISSLLPQGTELAQLSKVRPTELRDFAIVRLDERSIERALAVQIGGEALGDVTQDDVSRRVARQYEEAPYPRWEDVELPDAGWFSGQLRRIVPDHSLAFLDGDFDVLIAGCGTGRQAVHSTNGFGSQARVTASDLSAASLAYAKRKTDSLGVPNLTFRQQNILDLDPAGSQFDVIECLGVLHHMADPFEGWRKLLACLKPGGLMQIALYSKVSRSDIIALRSAADWPGADCSDREAQRYRSKLVALDDGDIGGTLTTSPDFYTMSTFRDLVLHQSEQQFTLDEISDFMASAGLRFHGFVLDPIHKQNFLADNPDEIAPGSFEAWSAYEREHPHLFNGMYQFFCSRED